MKISKKTSREGWTVAMESSRYHEFVPGTPYARFGVALLFYRPERHLSVSVWLPSMLGIGGWSSNVRLWGPRKRAWQR